MPVTTVIAPSTYEADAQKALHEYLSGYFDGNDHVFGIDTYTFPEATLKFARQQFKVKLPFPVIVVEFGETTAHDRLWADLNGVRILRPAPFLFVVATSEPDNSWILHDQISSLLGVVLNGARAELAKSGLRIRRVGQANRVNVEGFQVSVRNVTMEVHLQIGNG